MDTVIIIPIYKLFNELEKFEIISIKQTIKILNGYNIYFIGPDHMETKGYENLCFENSLKFVFVSFSSIFFKTIDGYNKLLLSRSFYRRFEAFKYILLCQTDVYIFKDELKEWSNMDYDFIGAPWTARENDSQFLKFDNGANGGFSLRKVKSHLRVLSSFKRYNSLKEIFEWYNNFNFKGKFFYFPGLIKRILGLEGNTLSYFNNFNRNEDVFWSSIVPGKFKWFKIAPPEIAFRFSMEKRVEELLRMNKNLLPFGSHAFQKDSIWRRYISDFY